MRPREIAALRQRGSAGYTAPLRQSVSYTTGTLAPDASELGVIPLALSYKLLTITTSSDARVRLYDKAASQTADLSRPIGTDPSDGSGTLFEFISAPGLYNVTLSPLVSGTSMEASPSSDIPITVTNTGDSTATITVTFLFIREE